MCEEEATSVEHVPPKCLFPESKDVGGKNYRINLLTVPSCDKHNGKKSQDDEFLMVSLAGIVGNNSIGYQHYGGKIHRALKRTSFKLLDDIFIQKRELRLKNENKFMDVIWGTPDYKRLEDCFSHVAYGVYRFHFKNSFIGELKPYLGFLHHNEQNPKAFKAFLQAKAKHELDGKTQYGENPGVFYYQITEPDEFEVFLIHLCFYENTSVYVSLVPEGKAPSSLGMEMINHGFKTIIHLDDKEFEFN
jgi:hypothetical protein